MSLSKHVHPETILKAARDHPAQKGSSGTAHTHSSNAYGARYGTEPVPKYSIPSKGTDADATYQIIHDELSLDGAPLLNLASFVHTWMPDQATKLMVENMSKNLIDQDEYPMTQIIHTRCISMLANLWHAPKASSAIGTATTGSSEAIQLGGLAMKRIWQEKRKAQGKSIHEPGPNIVMGANAQVALEKFARYFDVECRLVPVSEKSKYRLDPKRAMEYVDENTIGVFVILGSTYTGHYEPVKEMADLLDEYEKKTGINVPIHVDAASGGFFAPFASPKLEWDFKLPRVVSINTSGHKFGLAYVGVGWVIWRDKKHLPKDLIFELHYLGSSYDPGLPVVSFRFTDEFQKEFPDIQQKWIQTLLRSKGWIVPNYELPPELEKVQILRVVVRENMTETLIHQLITDLIEITESLKSQDGLHALATLASHSAARRDHSALKPGKEHEKDEGDGRGKGQAYSGTYAKPC
ncbi:hypothetical protein M422DRAFT_27078 [Sphaerobolus stellatus SS14]|nr:hypothetical protein M422DRAFT_27078 [Sphaerobolus stellatus SS14]